MKNTNLLSVFILLFCFLGTSCENKTIDPTVTYEVTSANEDFDISYIIEDGEQIQKTIKTNFWTTSFIGKKGDLASLTVKANNLNDKIEAKIIYDGKIIKETITYGEKSGENITSDISIKLPY